MVHWRWRGNPTIDRLPDGANNHATYGDQFRPAIDRQALVIAIVRWLGMGLGDTTSEAIHCRQAFTPIWNSR